MPKQVSSSRSYKRTQKYSVKKQQRHSKRKRGDNRDGGESEQKQAETDESSSDESASRSAYTPNASDSSTSKGSDEQATPAVFNRGQFEKSRENCDFVEYRLDDEKSELHFEKICYDWRQPQIWFRLLGTKL
ncbi:hypothetical protein QAD02_002364 [Eretmocerus hayati]|uniref:Uncharacterized protein n=1 Tax=Eretmocerus hayati TaxID=131215 RepID=A0ACC2NIW3_9HYME|nr:hypothetical protein QAD02_002364 [Eretmocerus hayati]